MKRNIPKGYRKGGKIRRKVKGRKLQSGGLTSPEHQNRVGAYGNSDIKNINNGNLMNDWPGKRKHRRKHERLSERHKTRYKKGGGVRKMHLGGDSHIHPHPPIGRRKPLRGGNMGERSVRRRRITTDMRVMSRRKNPRDIPNPRPGMKKGGKIRRKPIARKGGRIRRR